MIGKEIALGPGKVDLLEAIARTGSISSAARDLGLSYRRAWVLVATMNKCFQVPLVIRATGGKGGGGANLSELGERIIGLYRRMEEKTHTAIRKDWNEIQKSLKQTKT
jgi:molybdate transport system regulatory protein